MRRSGWHHVRVGDALRLVNGRAFKPSEWRKQGTPIVRIQNLNDLSASFNYYDGVLPEKFRVRDGDLLFAWSGTPGTSFGAHIWQGGDAWLNQHIFRVEFNASEFDRRFLRLAINQNLDEYIRAAHGGAGLAHITKGRFEESQIPRPDTDVQRQVVAEIEKQFTRLDAGVAALKRVQAKLKRYRGSVLKAACEGRLVESEASIARREGRSYETGAELLGRMLAERREAWAANPRSERKKYVEPVAPDGSRIHEAPDGWGIASLEQLTSASRVICYGILMPKDNVPDGVLYVKVRDLKGDMIDITTLNRTSVEIATKYARASLQTGDLLLAIRGTYGRVAEVPAGLNGGNITQDTARLAVSPLMHRGYVACSLRAAVTQSYFKRVARGVAVKGVNIGDVRPCPVLVPPLAEQLRIVGEVERLLSVVDELQAIVTANLRRAARLRQSVLHAAFSGDLIAADLSRPSAGR